MGQSQSEIKKILNRHIKEVEEDRHKLLSSAYSASSTHLAHNKGMRKGLTALEEELTSKGLLDDGEVAESDAGTELRDNVVELSDVQ